MCLKHNVVSFLFRRFWLENAWGMYIYMYVLLGYYYSGFESEVVLLIFDVYSSLSTDLVR